ncbi:Glyoxylase, beta-lactamase superfamily II [Octadecabacter temperatus]|uniref:Putative quorum-quenching lactonase YtnP n=1 Tax=Octadecabacter temperatus TaxID=1458307 RepID=A0A0K0Y346_9RHOB|nr:MBL fold metallo-hydrolase [Octadecabacter temperatus]AKS45364.1 putative quorum-quenching lactonase YtnP [Octadecabacter temperatus]SIN91354.1 Glyoxylase, beta-lactamase superfamily II [Octadecabacter temperatus]
MPAPLHGSYLHPIHRVTVGETDVTTVRDGALTMEVSPPFLLDHNAEDIAQISAAAHLPATQIENGFTPTLVNTGSKLVLFDTGFGAMGRDKGAGNLRQNLALAGYAPEDIDVIAFTHMHPDHIGGLLEDGKPAFPNAQLMIGRREFDEWFSGASIPPQRAQNRDLFLKIIAPLADQFTFLEDGSEVCSGVTAMAAFGHSLGHMMYHLESGGDRALVWGDVANHYVYSVEHPDSPVGFDDDKDMAIATRKRVLDMVHTDGILVAGHHMPFPSIGYIERGGDKYRWVPASYQHRI